MAEKHRSSDFDDDITAPTRPIGRDFDLAPAPVGDERVESVAHLIVNEGPAENFDAGLHLAGTYIDNPDAIVNNSISRPALAGTEYFHGGKTASLPGPTLEAQGMDTDGPVPDPSRDGAARQVAQAHDIRRDLAGVEPIEDDLPPFDVGPAPDVNHELHPIDIDHGVDLIDHGGVVPDDQDDLDGLLD